MFEKEYCARLGLSCELPLRIVGDIGGGGALARIEKGRKVMRDKKSEWSQIDELPVSMRLTLALVHLLTQFVRLRFLYTHGTDTTPSSPVPSRKNSRPRQTLL